MNKHEQVWVTIYATYLGGLANNSLCPDKHSEACRAASTGLSEFIQREREGAFGGIPCPEPMDDYGRLP